MDFYEKIKHARELLGIPERASIEFVKKKYQEALLKWHPDRCKDEEKTLYEEKTKEIIKAGKLLLDYCNKYEIDFSEIEVNKHIPAEEFWTKKFGDDHLWGR
ncbi:MAG: DnaJ domain-containing protein [Brevinematales bacterium]|nr:DnaJ domain-containing protein [Brevinematales bacterium]